MDKANIENTGIAGQEITSEQIEKWKETYGKLYKTSFEDYVFYWRKLKRKEYTALMTDKDILASDARVYIRQEQTVRMTVLHPSGQELERILEDNGYICTVLTDEIMLKSGFNILDTNEV